MILKRDMKVRCLKSGAIGKIMKVGGKTSKVRIPIFGQKASVVKQIPNKYLRRRF